MLITVCVTEFLLFCEVLKGGFIKIADDLIKMFVGRINKQKFNLTHPFFYFSWYD